MHACVNHHNSIRTIVIVIAKGFGNSIELYIVLMDIFKYLITIHLLNTIIIKLNIYYFNKYCILLYSVYYLYLIYTYVYIYIGIPIYYNSKIHCSNNIIL